MKIITKETAAGWLAAVIAAAGLGAALVAGSAVASATDQDTQTKIYEIQQEVTMEKAGKPCDAECKKWNDYIR